MSVIRARCVMNVPAENAAEFEAIARAITDAERASGRKPIAYDYYRNESDGTYVLHEHFGTAEEYIEHANLVDPAILQRLFEISSVASLEICGDLSPEGRTIASQWGAVFCTPVATTWTD